MGQYKLGFIGAGNMAEAICRAVLTGNVYSAAEVVAWDVAEQRRRLFRDDLEVNVAEDNTSVAGESETVILAVKPQQIGQLLDEIRGSVSGEQLVVTIAAGISTTFIESNLARGVPVVRVMPNTALLVGYGMTALSKGRNADEDHLMLTKKIFASAGMTIVVPEESMDAVTALSGSGPAYFFYLVEAMVQAGLDLGLSRNDALKLASQTCLGAGNMLLRTQAAPEDLRRRVTSPGGTTEAAIEVLEADGVKKMLTDAVKAAAKRSAQLGR